MPTIRFEIGSVPVNLTARSSRLTEFFADYFRYYHPQPATRLPGPSLTARQSELVIELKTRHALPPLEALIPQEAELISRAGAVQLWREAKSAASSERFYFHSGTTAFRVDPENGRLEGLVTPQACALPHLLTNTYTLFPLLLGLRARGFYHLHAAAVVSPDDRLYLICGEQRSGKTTLTTALGLAGWRPVSDDTLLIGANHSTAQLLALKKSFHISDDLLARWPALGGLARQHHYFQRTAVAGLEFFGTAKLADTSFTHIDHIILPQITNEPLSNLQPISSGEAILRLAEQSMFFQLWRQHTERQLHLLAQLAGRAACYRLLAGTDLLTDPHRAATILPTGVRHQQQFSVWK